ncbi:metalloproteinase inhibitor 2-like [Hippocampus zosterae]|uniref:metalloproteinase inhibitor 2-like n=1 Tax=Hippocampus zosterae TaxID=109293 RepID=UPI00223E6B93|nr:metalloproteinase inhibitor 2-like [Hippocampus zosterae]
MSSFEFVKGLTMSCRNFALPLLLLCLWGLWEEGAQACTCFPQHRQQLFCQKDVVVMRAKVVGVTPGVGATPTKYDIKQRKIFNGAEKIFGAVYTNSHSVACGVTLTKGVEYLLLGRLHFDGSLHIQVCDINQPWEALSAAQKSLLYRYGEGCDCEIKLCISYPCCITKPTECLWTGFQLGAFGNPDQELNSACIKKGDGCFWERGVAGPQSG